MALTKQSLDILLDLIEIKVSSLQIQDRDDARELNKLRKCRQELLLELNQATPKGNRKPIDPSVFLEKVYKKPSSLRH